jgi:hypothetical protein
MEIMRNKLLICVGCLVIVMYSSNSDALRLNYGLGAGVEYSDNITRVSENEISGTSRRLNIFADLNHESETLKLTFRPTITYNNYTRDELDDRTSYQLDSSLLWEIVDSRLFWSIEDYIAQTSIDVRAPDTTFNQQTTNVLFTGPDLNFNMGSGKNIALAIRYADFYYEVDDTTDNERVGGLLKLSNQSSPTTNYSINLAAADVRYKDTVINEDYYRNDIFLGLNRQGSRYNFAVDAGYTKLDREINEDLDGLLAHLNITVNLSNKSNLTILGNSEYTDSSRNFLLSRYLTEELRRFNTSISGDILYEKSLLAAYAWSDLTNNINIQLSKTEQDYEDDALDNTDRTIKYASISLGRRLTGLLGVFISGSWSNTYYKKIFIEDDDQTYSVGMNYRLSRSLDLILNYRYTTRDSTDITSNYIENAIFAGINLRR